MNIRFIFIGGVAHFALSGSCLWAGEEDMAAAPAGEVKECYVGTYASRIVPEQVRVFPAPVAGIVTDVIFNHEERIPKGTVIGKLNKEDIELEQEELQVALLKERIEKEEEIDRLLKEREECVFNLSLSKEERLYSKDQDKKFEKRMLDLIDRKIKLAKEELSVSQKRQTEDFKKKVDTFILKMPFDGRLKYGFTLNSDQDEYYVDASKEIVGVCDDSAFYFSIVISSPEITQLPPESFKFVGELGTGKKIEGTFSHKREEKTANASNPEITTFFFKVNPENSETMYKMLGVRPLGKLYFSGDENMIFINKIELASRAEAKETQSWQELLEKVKPGYELVLVGETQIIARKK